MPTWRNTSGSYGLMAVICHWLAAVAVIGLFVLGLWMTDMTYYDPWYQRAPDIHRSVGIVLAILIVWRLLWRLANIQPSPLPSHKRREQNTARVTHLLLYLLLFGMFFSGYMITTAEGDALDVFNWFSIPAITTGRELGIKNLEDLAGDIHEILAFTLIGLAILHASAALKHHFIDKDRTLLRMLNRK